jgi:hypothetical protein
VETLSIGPAAESALDRQQETPEQGGNNPPSAPRCLPLLADRVYAPGTPLTGSPLSRL